MSQPTSTHIQSIFDASLPIFRFATGALYTENVSKPNVSDFAFGNPHDMPVAGFADALQKWSAPQNKDWFAYKMSEPDAQRVVAESLRAWRGIAFEANDIFLTNGAFAALAVTLGAILDAGDEVIFNSPPWFFYEQLILAQRAKPVRVRVNAETFDLDLEAIDARTTHRLHCPAADDAARDARRIESRAAHVTTRHRVRVPERADAARARRFGKIVR